MNSCMAKLLALRWEDHEHVVKTELWICKSCDPPLLVHSRSLVRIVLHCSPGTVQSILCDRLAIHIATHKWQTLRS